MGKSSKRAKSAFINYQEVAEPRIIPTPVDDLTIIITNTTTNASATIGMAKNTFRPGVKDIGERPDILLACV
jgi:hypothetical protein